MFMNYYYHYHYGVVVADVAEALDAGTAAGLWVSQGAGGGLWRALCLLAGGALFSVVRRVGV